MPMNRRPDRTSLRRSIPHQHSRPLGLAWSTVIGASRIGAGPAAEASAQADGPHARRRQAGGGLRALTAADSVAVLFGRLDLYLLGDLLPGRHLFGEPGL